MGDSHTQKKILVPFWWYWDHYEGHFKNGKFEGAGTYYFPNGDKYEGSFKREKKHGKGIYYFASGQKFVGTFKYDN